MKNLHFKLRWVSYFIFAFSLFISPLASSYAACCAGHGGVASCNKTTGYKMCKDGTASPTCTCKKSKDTTKSKKAQTTTSTTAPAATKTKSKSNWWGGQSTTTKSTSGNSAKGCCSKHGGVAQCNTATGHQMCKDGSQSPTCTCH